MASIDKVRVIVVGDSGKYLHYYYIHDFYLMKNILFLFKKYKLIFLKFKAMCLRRRRRHI